MPHGVDWNESTQCAVLHSDDLEKEPDLDRPRVAVENGLYYALEMQVIESIVENARDQRRAATISDLVDAFVYYHDNDAYIDWSGK